MTPRQRNRALIVSCVLIGAVHASASCGLLLQLASNCADDTDCAPGDTCVEGVCTSGAAPNTDAGEVDAMLTDATQTDAVADDAGSTVTVPWWDRSYGWRMQLTFRNVGSALRVNDLLRFRIDHAALSATGLSRADGDDVRVVYWDGVHNQALSRVCAARSRWGAADTELFVRAAQPIPAGGEDRAYFVYFGNSDAGRAPVTGVPPARYYLSEELAEHVTGLESFTPRATLSFSPSRTDELWVVVATWRQRTVGRTSETADLGESQLLLNGAVREGFDHITYRQLGEAWKSLGTSFWITGTTALQTVQLAFAANDGEDAIDNIRLLAFLVPLAAAADVQRAELLPQAVSIGPSDLLALSFTPSAAGDYLWLASGFVHEGPSADGCELQLLDEAGVVRRETAESYIAEGGGFAPLTHFGLRPLAASPCSLQLRLADPQPGGHRHQGLAQLAFRADAFDQVEARASSDHRTSATEAVELELLQTPATNTEHDHVYLAVLDVDHDDREISWSTFAEVRLDGHTVTEDEMRIDRWAYDNQVSFASAETSTGGRTLSVHLRTSDPGHDAVARNLQLLALRYREAAAVLGPQERVP